MGKVQLSKKKNSTDRISNLPYAVKENIIKLLPLSDAVRTRVLSTGWRYSWLTIPSLDFDFLNFRRGNFDIEPIVYHVLQQHKGPIVEFILKSDKYVKQDAIDHWLHFLSDNSHLEHLELWFSGAPPSYLVSQDLFNYQNLRKLSLKNVKVQLPVAFKGFSRLVDLHLTDVDNAAELLSIFTSKCPMLEMLSIVGSYKNMCIDIRSPNLKAFRFCGSFGSICFETPKLDFITMSCYDFEERKSEGLFDNFRPCEGKGNLIKVFSNLGSLRTVDLDNTILQFSASGGVPQELLCNLHCLDSLTLRRVTLKSAESISIAVCLIRSSPTLHSFKISFNVWGKGSLASIQYLKAQQKCKDPISCTLQNVRIEYFRGGEAELEFVKLVLLGATALEKLEIQFPYYCQLPLQDRYKMVVEIASFPRASPKAVVVFTD